jgi:hypothetical protein
MRKAILFPFVLVLLVAPLAGVAQANDNQPPVADPGGPYVLPLVPNTGPFDGSGSSDPDGDPVGEPIWYWGDGSYEVWPTLVATHTYAAVGIYDVCLAVSDGTVYSQQACTTAVIYDPSAGFVTGGGWVDSPAGAYVADTSLTGKATFGFVSKYQKGANLPTGNTEFRFQAADLNFHSSSYEWLVVTGGDHARYKGVGTINGAGPYKFMLWAGDGTGTDGADTFRIKIWEENNSVETVIYDNGTNQNIAGGSILVHTKK